MSVRRPTNVVYSLFDVYEICRRRAADVLVLSPHETGGLLPFRKAAAIAEAAGMAINLHGRFVTGSTDLALHYVVLTIPNLTDGNQIMHQILKEDIITAPDISPQAGKLGLYDRPGLGVRAGSRSSGASSRAVPAAERRPAHTQPPRGAPPGESDLSRPPGAADRRSGQVHGRAGI